MTSGLGLPMPIELTARTEAGARLVAIAEELSQELAARAAEHDRDGTYPFEAIDALKAAGYFTAPVPVELGGLGVSSAHDLVVASSRLARGDASVAIGVNMHLVSVHNMERRRQVAVASGAERRARGFASSLEQIARDGVVRSATCSPGCSTPRPRSASPNRRMRSRARASPGASTAMRARACRPPTTPSTSLPRVASSHARPR